MKFVGFPLNTPRRAAVVGDFIDLRLETSNADPYPALSVSTTTQPSGSNVLWTVNISSSALALPGYYAFTVVCGAFTQVVEVICFPAAVLTIAPIQFAEQFTAAPRADNDRRVILNAFAMACTKANAQAALEGGAATAATNYGANPTLTGQTPHRFADYGGTFGR